MNFKKDFPIFLNNPNLIYLDNGATSHKPLEMIEALSTYYSHFNSNIGRGVYKLAEISQSHYDQARKNIALFINANPEDILFTSSCTASLNQAAYIAGQLINQGEKIALTILEHHANILPWQRLAKEKNIEIKFIKDINQLLNPEDIEEEFWNNVKVISLAHVSNVTGITLPVEKWIKEAKKHNVITVIDGAQGICSNIVDVKQMDFDFYCFSAHKLFGPMGLGILYINNNFLKKNKHIEPHLLGGGIIEDVLENKYILMEDNTKFEPGTPNVANIIAFNATLHYLQKNKWADLLTYTHELGYYLYQQLKENLEVNLIIDNITEDTYENLYKKNYITTHINSFYIKDIHPHDLGTYLSEKNIALRVGKHCAHPLHEHLKINSTARTSLAFYNTKDDIDTFIVELKRAISFFKGK